MTNEELLSSLRDIVPPVEPAWWHIAPVYFLIVVLLLTAGLLSLFWMRHKKANQAMQQAHTALLQIKREYQANVDQRILAIKLSRWLKQVSMLAFPEQQPASLQGMAWLDFLDQSNTRVCFSESCSELFSKTVYSRNPELDAQEIISLCENWLTEIKPRLKGRGQF
ncbi:MAG: DUF4381 domain-containing protein [Pseudomonadota bacterium]